MPTTPAVRVAAVADLDPVTAHGLWRLRQDVFVVEQHCPYPDLDGRDLEPGTRHVLLVEDGDDGDGGPDAQATVVGTVVGCARVLDDGEVWRIGRVALARSARGRGLADVVMRAALEAAPVRDVVLDAQAPLARWYGTLGFEVTGPVFVEDGIDHLPMRLRR